MPNPMKKAGWLAVAALGAVALGVIALKRGESIPALWLVVAAVCSYFVAYRFYGLFIASAVLGADGSRPTPAVRRNDGLDYVPTNKYVLFGHHFAAIAGAGPLVGPVLAAQMGYLPGTLWIIAGVVFAGAVQDSMVLFCSMRRDGRSLGDMIRSEMGPVAGSIASVGVLLIMIIILAILAMVVVKALAGSPWGTFTVFATIPIAILMGIYSRILRPGRIGEMSVIGFILLMAALVYGRNVAESETLAPLFTYTGKQLALIIIGYGFVASVLPVWLLLAPRDYLSTFLKIGAIVALALGIAIVMPPLKMHAITQFVDGTGPVFKGHWWPFLFITIACGAVSGFHALISSGTTPKMIENENQVAFIGYGGMLMESFVAAMAMVAASVIEPGIYFAMNSPGAVIGGAVGGRDTGVQAVHRTQHRIGPFRPHGTQGIALGQIEMVHGPQHAVLTQAQTGGVIAQAVTEDGGHVGLVQHHPVLDPVTQAAHGDAGILGERAEHRPALPAATILERLRQIPVIQAGHGPDARRQQRIHQPVIEIQTLGVHRAVAIGHDARPRQREAIGVEARRPHQRHVLGIAVVMVAGGGGGAAVLNAPGLAKAVPDVAATPVLGQRALDLIGRGRGAPQEARRHLQRTHQLSPLVIFVKSTLAVEPVEERLERFRRLLAIALAQGGAVSRQPSAQIGEQRPHQFRETMFGQTPMGVGRIRRHRRQMGIDDVHEPVAAAVEIAEVMGDHRQHVAGQSVGLGIGVHRVPGNGTVGAAMTVQDGLGLALALFEQCRADHLVHRQMETGQQTAAEHALAAIVAAPRRKQMGEGLGQQPVEGMGAGALPLRRLARLGTGIPGPLQRRGETPALLGHEAFGQGADGIGTQAAARAAGLDLQPGGEVADHGVGDGTARRRSGGRRGWVGHAVQAPCPGDFSRFQGRCAH